MKNFFEWAKMLDLDVPEHDIDCEWFGRHGLPLIVECACCGSTLALPNAMIDEEDYTYCAACAGVE